MGEHPEAPAVTRTAPALVIFDCDGVLVDSERMEIGTLSEALTWLDCDLDAAELHDRNRGGVIADLLAIVAEHTGRPTPDWFMPRYRELQFARLRSVEVVPGAREAVEAVVARDLPRCVVSGGPMGKMETSLGATGLWDAFAPHLYSCYDIGDHKPSPGIYHHALTEFGVDAAHCLAVEDSVTGVTAAHAAGVPVVGLARDTRADDLLAAGARDTVTAMYGFADLLRACLDPDRGSDHLP
jgi:beta-phosphoglucomutase-like phosphatase (HAD superfamily)